MAQVPLVQQGRSPKEQKVQCSLRPVSNDVPGISKRPLWLILRMVNTEKVRMQAPPWFNKGGASTEGQQAITARTCWKVGRMCEWLLRSPPHVIPILLAAELLGPGDWRHVDGATQWSVMYAVYLVSRSALVLRPVCTTFTWYHDTAVVAYLAARVQYIAEANLLSPEPTPSMAQALQHITS